MTETTHRQLHLGARLTLLYKNMEVLAAGSVMVACLVVGLLYNKIAAPILLVWLLSILLINAVRFQSTRKFSQTPLIEQERRYWRIRAILLSLVHGIAWGALVIVVIKYADSSSQGMMAAILLGMSAIATPMTAYFMPVFLAFMLPTLLPVATGFLLSQGANLAFNPLMLVVTAICVLPMIAWKVQRVVIDTLDIAQRNRELSGSLEVQTLERVVAQDHLRILNEQHRQLLQSTNEGVLGVDREGLCSFINTAGLEILGFSEEEFLHADVHKLIHHTTNDGDPYLLHNCPIHQAYEDGRNSHVTTDIMFRKDGSSFPAEYSASPLIDNGIVLGAVVMFRDVTDSRAMSRRLEFLARHDALTGLYNRKSFENKLQELIGSSSIEESQHVLCYLDIDQFKIINDTCGHQAGDLLLQKISRLMHNHIRHSDYLARLGGDEFGLLLQNCTLMQAVRIIEKLFEVVRDYRFEWEKAVFSINMSVGVVEINQQTESSVSALSHADSACYMAKESGRNRMHIYRVNDSAIAKRRDEMEWVAKIQKALEEDRFFLMQQPIVDTSPTSSEHKHFEILVRMKDIDGETISPIHFIPPAERYNLMSKIDRWVINSVFQWMQSHPDELEFITFCAINLSGQSLTDELMLDYIVESMVKYKIPGEKLCFEITETAAIQNFEHAKELIDDLKIHGCQFALDDFGSGMSSFSYLKNLAVDYLKIDGSFVKDILTDPHNRAIVEAVNQVGQSMGKKTIAEFVENNEIRDELDKIGVDFVQGYGIMAPVPLVTEDEIVLLNENVVELESVNRA